MDTLIRRTGQYAKWLTTILVVLVLADVVMRYVFSVSHAWLMDFEWHCFALIFLMGAAYTLRADRHVRVDVLYMRWTERRRAWIDLLGTLLFLIPWCLVVIYTSFRYAEVSFLIGEKSPDPGGLPARFIIKGAITLGFILLLLQAIMLAIRSVMIIRSQDTSQA